MPGPPVETVDPAIALRDAAAVNPELQRLLAERDLLMQRMEEIAERSPGSFAGHDTVRYPVEPLGERRTRDTRWARARDDGRSAAIQRILEARRSEAAAGFDQWSEARERQRVEAASDAQAERQATEAEARALDERIERARRDLLAERWAAQPPEPGEDWHKLREQQAAEALADARARTAEAAAREQALERRIARDRVRRPDDWSDERDRARAQALDLARRQAVEAAAAEQALDRRLARAREDRLRENRAAHDPERAPQWVPPSDRRDLAPLPPEPPRKLPPTAAERSLDERIARARETAPRAAPLPRKDEPSERVPRDPGPVRETRRKAEPDERGAARREAPVPAAAAPAPAEPPMRERRTAPAEPARRVPEPEARLERPRPERRPAPAPLGERPRAPAESFEQRQDRLREARRQEARARRIGEAAIRSIERGAGAARKLHSSLDRLGRELREVGADDETMRQIDRARGATANLSAGSERVERAAGAGRDRAQRPAGRDRDALRSWQDRRDRRPRKHDGLGDLGGFRRAGERRLGMPVGSVDELTALRDRARELWPEEKKEKKQKEKEKQPARTTAERLQDLDKRREQALERLKARREGERRDERRRGLSLDRLASMGDRFGNPGG